MIENIYIYKIMTNNKAKSVKIFLRLSVKNIDIILC